MYAEEPTGTFVVRYEQPGDLLPSLQTELVDALRASCARRKTGVIFLLDDQVTWVDTSVPNYWLQVTATLGLSGMAIVTRSAAVRVAATGFRLANIVRGVKLPVQSFEEEAPARTWMESALAA